MNERHLIRIILNLTLISVFFLTVISSMTYAAPVTIEVGEEIQGEDPVGGWSPLKAEYTDEEYEEPETRSFRRVVNGNEDNIFFKGASSIGYNSLTKESQRTFYSEMNTVAVNFMNSTEDLSPQSNGDYYVGSIPYASLGLSYDEALQAFYAYDYDHPAYYWISNFYSYNDNNIFLRTEAEYASVSARNGINNQIINGVEEYCAIAEKAENTLDKIAVIHDLIVSDVDYAYMPGTKTPVSAKWAHSVHGVFDPAHKSVVCEGYADTFSLLMNYLGIPNYYIVGTAGSGGAGGGGGHAWNAVYDDGIGKYLYMDLTWDDLGDNKYYYTYFGMPKSDFETRHFKYGPTNKGSAWLYPLNGNFADSFNDTYYNRGGFSCDTSDYAGYAKKINTKVHRFGTLVSFISDDSDKLGKVYYNLTGSRSYSYYDVSYKGNTYRIIVQNMTEDVDLSSAEITLAGDKYAYTGGEIRPTVEKVVCNGIKLIQGLNYSVSYENNVSAGTDTAKAVITGATRFSGRADKSFSILNSSEAITDSMVTLSNASFVYNGDSQKPSVTVARDGSSLIKDTDYTVSFSGDTVNAGTVTVTVKGKGAYSGTVEKTYTISPASISGFNITIQDDYDLTYDGYQKTPIVTGVKNGTESVLDPSDYDVSYEDNIDAGTAAVRVTGKGNYKDTASKTFDILQADISLAAIELSRTTFEYVENGTYEPDVTVIYRGRRLSPGTDYSVEYSDNSGIGNAKVTVTGTGNYSGTAEAGFVIVEKKSIDDAEITLEYTAIEYDGSEKKPGVTVKYGEGILVEDSDYVIGYDDDTVNAGRKNLTVTAAGDTYFGSRKLTYTVTEADISDAALNIDADGLVYTGQAVTPDVTVIKGDSTLIEDRDYELTYYDNFNAGTNSARASVTGRGNYKNTAEKTFSIARRPLSDAAVSIEYTSTTYDGSAKEPEIRAEFNGYLLSKDTDYDLFYSNNLNAGGASCSVTAKGNFSGSVVKEFTIEKAAGEIRYETAEINKITGDEAFTNALTKTGDGTVSFGSDMTGVAEVDPSTGQVTITGDGSATITATVTDSNNYSYRIKTASYVLNVRKPPSELLNAPTARELSYSGVPQDLVTAGTALNGTVYYRVGTSGDFLAGIPRITDAGIYYVYYKVVGDYDHSDTDIFGPIEAEISRIDSSITDIPSAKELIYSGDEQELVDGGTAEGGVIEYSLDDIHYSETIPTAVNAGYHTVYYKVKGDRNHYNAAGGSLQVFIEKRPLSAQLIMSGWVTGEEPSEPVLTGNSGNGTVTIEYKEESASDDEYKETVPTEPGRYLARASIEETANYKAAVVTAAFVISEDQRQHEGDEPEDQNTVPEEETINVSDNKPQRYSSETRGDYTLSYYHIIPFWGKSKLTPGYFGGITISANGISDNKVTKIKINKKKQTIQITGVEGVDKMTMRDIRKATKGANGLPFSYLPYYVRQTDNVSFHMSKKGYPKSIKILINNKLYKAKKKEVTYNMATETISFNGLNLAGSYKPYYTSLK